MLQYVNSAGEVVDAHGRPLSQATDIAPDEQRFEGHQAIQEQTDKLQDQEQAPDGTASAAVASDSTAQSGRRDQRQEAKRDEQGPESASGAPIEYRPNRFDGEVELFLRATSGDTARGVMSGRAGQKPQVPSAHEAAADVVADRHAALASSMLEAIEAVLSSFSLEDDAADTALAPPAPAAAGGAEATTASATAALSARVIASLSFLEAALAQFRGSHGQVAVVLLRNLRSAVLKPVHPETARVLLEAADEAAARRDGVTAAAVHEVLEFPATLQRLVQGVTAAVTAQAARETGGGGQPNAPPPMGVHEMQQLGRDALKRMVTAQRVVSTALSRRLNLLPPPPPEGEGAESNPPAPPSSDPTAAFVGKGGREHPLRAMERQLVLASAAPTFAGEAAQLAVLAERQCAHVAGLEAARDKMAMMIDKTQRIINSTAVRLQGALLGRYFTVWRKQTAHSKRQLGSLAAMLRRQARQALLRSCFDALITEGRSNKVGRLQTQLDELQAAVARASDSRHAALSEVASLETARVRLMDQLDAMRRRNASHSVELERATALQRVLPEFNLRRLAGAWLTMSDRVFESQMDRVFRQVETLAGGMTPPPPPGTEGGSQAGARSSFKGGPAQRFGAEMFPPSKRGHRVSQGGDMGWEAQHLVNPLLLLTEKELLQCRAAAAAADGYGEGGAGGVHLGQGGRPVTAPGAAGEGGAASGNDTPFDGGALPPLPPFEAAALRVLVALPLDILLLRWSNHHLLNANGAVWQDWWRVWNSEAEGMASVPAPGVQNTEQLRALSESVEGDMRTALRRDRGLKLAHELMEVGFVKELKGVQGGVDSTAEAEEDITASTQLSREGAIEASLAAALGQDAVDAAEVFRQQSGTNSALGSSMGMGSPSFTGLGQSSAPGGGAGGGYIPGAGSPELSSRLGGANTAEGGVDLTPHGVVAGPTVRFYHAMARIRRRATLAAAAARARDSKGVQGGNTGVASTGGGTTGYGAVDMGHTETAASAPLLVAENVGDDWQSGHAYALLLHRLSASNAFACAQHVTVGAAALTDMPFVVTPHADASAALEHAGSPSNTEHTEAWGAQATEAVQLPPPHRHPLPLAGGHLEPPCSRRLPPHSVGGLIHCAPGGSCGRCVFSARAQCGGAAAGHSSAPGWVRCSHCSASPLCSGCRHAPRHCACAAHAGAHCAPQPRGAGAKRRSRPCRGRRHRARRHHGRSHSDLGGSAGRVRRLLRSVRAEWSQCPPPAGGAGGGCHPRPMDVHRDVARRSERNLCATPVGAACSALRVAARRQ